MDKKDITYLNKLTEVMREFSKLFGNYMEVVIHRVDNLEESVLSIINPHISGRAVNSPMTNVGLEIINSIEYGNFEVEPYFSKNSKGQPLKSITVPIFNSKNKIIGLLCVNLSLNIPLEEFLPKEINLSSDLQLKGSSFKNELFLQSSEDVMDTMIREAIDKVNQDSTIKSREKNRNIVVILYQKGFFNFKHATAIVAKALRISTDSVYSYIRKHEKIKEEL